MGLFIVLDGIDGCGKSSQQHLVAERLRARGLRVALTRYPDREARLTGPLLVRLTQGHLPLVDGLKDEDPAVAETARMTQMQLGQLIFALNRREVAAALEDLVEANDVVISDRYALSGRAYGEAVGLSIEDSARMARSLEWDLRQPDRTIVLDLPPAIARSRRSGRDRADDAFDADLRLQEAVRHAYLRLAGVGVRIQVIDGCGDEGAVTERIVDALETILPRA